MLEEVNDLLQEVKKFVPKSEKEVEEFRLSFLGKKGKMNAFFAAFKDVPNKNKKEFGGAINIFGDSPIISNTIIKDNSSRFGGGINIADNPTPALM